MKISTSDSHYRVDNGNTGLTTFAVFGHFLEHLCCFRVQYKELLHIPDIQRLNGKVNAALHRKDTLTVYLHGPNSKKK